MSSFEAPVPPEGEMGRPYDPWDGEDNEGYATQYTPERFTSNEMDALEALDEELEAEGLVVDEGDAAYRTPGDTREYDLYTGTYKER